MTRSTATATRPQFFVGWSRIQQVLFVIAVFEVVKSIIGFIAEPSFAIGPDAPTEQILWMDFNGWHALAGLLLFAPALLFATRRSWAVLFCLVGGVGGALPGVWALFSNQVMILFAFPNNMVDAVQHLLLGGVMVGMALYAIHRDGWDEILRDVR